MTEQLYDPEHVARRGRRLRRPGVGASGGQSAGPRDPRDAHRSPRAAPAGGGEGARDRCRPGPVHDELARLGASIRVADISPVQLDAHRERLAALPGEAAVLDRLLADVSDLSAHEDEEFHAVVVYGGSLSDVFERVEVALAEVHRLRAPGASRRPQRDVPALYRSPRIAALVEAAGLSVVALSASDDLFSELDGPQVDSPLSEDLVAEILHREVEVCREPGVVSSWSRR